MAEIDEVIRDFEFLQREHIPKEIALELLKITELRKMNDKLDDIYGELNDIFTFGVG